MRLASVAVTLLFPSRGWFALLSEPMAEHEDRVRDRRDKAFFGHPVGLATLFFTEMWERFSYYGGRALLFLFMIAPLAKGGLGMSETSAGLVAAIYLATVYLMSLPGGWIADRFLGQRFTVIVGAVGIIIGNVLLALPIDGMFYPGLGVITLGTGMLKPNVSTIVGQLYTAKDGRRDSAYTIYYMGINIGALIAPLPCGYFAQSAGFRSFLESHGLDPNLGWHVGFGAAAVGMVIGLVQYVLTQRWLGDAGKHPTVPSDPRRAARDRTVLGAIVAGLVVLVVLFKVVPAETITNLFGLGLLVGSVAVFYGLFSSARDAGERRRVLAMIPLFLGAVAFFGVSEQASTTLSVFAEKLTSRELLGFTVEASYYQSVNSIFIIVLAAVFAWLWLRLARAHKEPSSVMKFSIGMALSALSFVVMLPSLGAVMHGEKVTGMYLIALYFFTTCSELCISPVGLSSMSKLAPKRLSGMVMGTWFLGTSDGNYLAGRAAGFSAKWGFDSLFYFLIIACLVITVALFLVAPMIRRMMDSDAESVPANHASTAEPEPLPSARVIKSDAT
jgi:POT family proton-dependent oligopeptide transporter